MAETATKEIQGIGPLRSFIAILASIAVAGATFGFSLPLLSLVMEQRGFSASVIGLNTTAQFIGLVMVGPLVPRMLAMLGTLRMLALAYLGIVVIALLFPLFDDLLAWFVLRWLLGAAGVILVVAGETWINQIAGDRIRGRVVGLYGSMLAAGIAIGPIAIRWTGTEGWMPFVVLALATAMAIIPLLLAIGVAPRIVGVPRSRPWHLARVLPIAAVGPLVCGSIEGATLSLLPVHLLHQGYGETTATDAVTAMLLGGVVSQVPFGWAADHFDHRRLALMTGIVGAAGFLVLPLVTGGDPTVVLVTLFLTGSATFGLYTLALVMIGTKFRGADLAQANAGVIILYGIGSLAGPAISGPMMEWSPTLGLPGALTAFCAAFVVFVAIHAYGRRSTLVSARRSP